MRKTFWIIIIHLANLIQIYFGRISTRTIPLEQHETKDEVCEIHSLIPVYYAKWTRNKPPVGWFPEKSKTVAIFAID